MNHTVFDIVCRAVSAILVERGTDVPDLRPETPISKSGLDSLDIADLTTRLDEQIVRVPEEALRQYPQTLGELAELYARYQQVQPEPEAVQS